MAKKKGGGAGQEFCSWYPSSKSQCPPPPGGCTALYEALQWKRASCLRILCPLVFCPLVFCLRSFAPGPLHLFLLLRPPPYWIHFLCLLQTGPPNNSSKKTACVTSGIRLKGLSWYTTSLGITIDIKYFRSMVQHIVTLPW